MHPTERRATMQSRPTMQTTFLPSFRCWTCSHALLVTYFPPTHYSPLLWSFIPVIQSHPLTRPRPHIHIPIPSITLYDPRTDENTTPIYRSGKPNIGPLLQTNRWSNTTRVIHGYMRLRTFPLINTAYEPVRNLRLKWFDRPILACFSTRNLSSLPWPKQFSCSWIQPKNGCIVLCATCIFINVIMVVL